MSAKSEKKKWKQIWRVVHSHQQFMPKDWCENNVPSAAIVAGSARTDTPYPPATAEPLPLAEMATAGALPEVPMWTPPSIVTASDAVYATASHAQAFVWLCNSAGFFVTSI